MSIHDETNIVEWQKMAIANRDERIKLLESAIREFLSWTCYKDDEPDYLDALQTLRNLIENKS